jgi:hypothetical protein
LKLKNIKNDLKGWRENLRGRDIKMKKEIAKEKSLKGWRRTPLNLKARLEAGQRFRKNCCTLLTKRRATGSKDQEKSGSYKKIAILVSSTESQMVVKGRELFLP